MEAVIPSMGMEKSHGLGMDPESEQRLAHSLLIELLAYVQDLRKWTTAMILTNP